MTNNLIRLLVLPASIVALAAACGGGETGAATKAAHAASSTPGVETPDPGGKVVSVDMITDGDGNFFVAPEVRVRRGDVIRFVLASGVHNANFVADSNPGVRNLPTPTPMLQLPGQTYDVKIDLPPGRYYYHCDPHALLGMIAHVVVDP